MYTVIVETPSGRTTYKYSNSTFADRWKISGHLTLAKLSTPYSADAAKESLLAQFPQLKRTIEIMEPYGRLGDAVIEKIYDSLDADIDDIVGALHKVRFPTTSRERVYIPRILERFIDMHAPDRGSVVGRGEIVACLLFQDTVGKPNARYDVFIEGQPWHIKDHRNCDSTPLGRPSDASSSDWQDLNIFRFVKSMGLPINFGTSLLKENERACEAIRQRYLARYGIDDLERSAKAFELELHKAVVLSGLLGSAPGVIFLKADEKGSYFERVDLDEIKFHSVSADMIKICTEDDRFVNAIMHETRRHEAELARSLERQRKEEERRALANEKLRLREQERLTRAEERKRMKEFNLRKKIEARALEKQERLKERESKRRKNAEEFSRSWNNALSLDILSKELGLKESTLRTNRSIASKQYPDLKFKRFKKERTKCA